MDNENHKNTWNNFTRFVFVGDYCYYCCVGFNGDIFTLKASYENWISLRKSKC